MFERIQNLALGEQGEALPREFVEERARAFFKLSLVGVVITILNVGVAALNESGHDRLVSDIWVGSGIFVGFALSAWFSYRGRLGWALLCAPLGLILPIVAGDLLFGRYTERLLYLVIAVLVAGFGLSRRALLSFWALTLLGLALLMLGTPGHLLGTRDFTTLLLDLALILTGSAALFGMNARVTTRALAAMQAKHQEAERQRVLAEAAASRAEVANSSKSMFLANVSHELRTPLNAILGYVELIQEESEELEVAHGFDQELERVHDAGRQLLALINDVLDLSKMEAGRMELAPERFALCELFEELETMIAPMARANDDRFVCEAPARDYEVYTDRVRLRQVLLNLLSNAVKFTQGGEVRLTMYPCEGDRLCVVVSDTGIGMSEAQLDRLFEPFVQATAETSHRYGGTGLGLALSRRICLLLGGTIEAQSAPGEGSRFLVELPRELA